jgi:N-acetylmuramoyl-L-alanine amidase
MIKGIVIRLGLYMAVVMLAGAGNNRLIAQQKPVLSTIIIDPGHGGVDPGATGQISTEAAIALSISLKLGEALKQQLPGINLIFTRTTDILPGGGTDIHESLRFRAEMANQARGDLFIAIHCNAAGVKAGGWYAKRVTGHKRVKKGKRYVKVPIYETYYVKNWQHGTETFIWAADRGGFKGESINITQEEGGEEVKDSTNMLDLHSPEAMIRAQLYEKKFFAKSMLLASLVEEEFVKGGRESRGVKQRNEKGIWVLQATGMPSILIETGFVTHTEEEKYIVSDKGQEEIVAAIVEAVKRYKASLEESRPSPATTTTSTPVAGGENQ